MFGLVSRAAFEAATARADAEHENAQFLRRDILDLNTGWSKRYDDLLARYHEATGRVADLADLAIRPAPVNVAAPVPTFESFPPNVAAALAMANAGFPKDVQRATYVWADAQLKSGINPEIVAQQLRTGVTIDPDTAD